MISTLLLYEVVGVGELDYIGAILVGIVEEIGKNHSCWTLYQKAKHKIYLEWIIVGSLCRGRICSI